MNQQYSEIKNNSNPLDLREIPVLKYNVFYDLISDFLKDEAKHCLAYYGVETSANLKFYCCIADDNHNSVAVFSHEIDKVGSALKSLTPVCSQLHIFER